MSSLVKMMMTVYCGDLWEELKKQKKKKRIEELSSRMRILGLFNMSCFSGCASLAVDFLAMWQCVGNVEDDDDCVLWMAFGRTAVASVLLCLACHLYMPAKAVQSDGGPTLHHMP